MDILHKDIISLKERNQTNHLGGTLTIGNLLITSKKEYEINKDCTLIRLIIDNVFVLWFGNIYMNRGTPKQLSKLFSKLQNYVSSHEMQNLILIGDFNIDLNRPKDGKHILLKNLCKQFSLKIFETKLNTREIAKIDFLIGGEHIKGQEIDHIPSISDHNIIKWKINIQATKNPKQ